MSILNSTRRARLIAQLERKEAELEALRTTFLEIAGIPIEEYRFNSGEGGNQWAKRWDVMKLYKVMSSVEAEIDLLYRRLEQNAGLTRITVRRR